VSRRAKDPSCEPKARRALHLRWRLGRRIFAWFALAILLSGLSAGVVVGWGGSTTYRRDFQAAQSFAAGRFARVWDDDIGRDELARAVHEELHVGLLLSEADGRVIKMYGPCPKPRASVPVERHGARIGTVGLCPERRPGFGNLALPLVVMLVVLWTAARVIAKRVTRPVSEIERVAREIGQGRLSSRVDLAAMHGDDTAVLGQTLNEMAERVERQIADYRGLLAAVSHEIRTPLARMRLLVELGGKEGRLEELDREVVALDALVGELLAVSRVDLGAVTKRQVDAVDIARRALEDAHADASLLLVEGKGFAFDADPTLLVRAVRNLLENAERHGRGALRLRVAREQDDVIFEVEDDGPGLPAGEEERVFEPFYRAGKKEDGRSVGLGLAIVRRIAAAHGGRAYAENRPEGGARVGLALPVAP
jgi:signal transduction histidine kinase